MDANRFKLSSDKFVASLHHVRSLMYSQQLLADPSMAQVTRMLLWARQLPLQLFTGPLGKAVRKLNTSGHLVIDADERSVICCVAVSLRGFRFARVCSCTAAAMVHLGEAGAQQAAMAMTARSETIYAPHQDIV